MFFDPTCFIPQTYQFHFVRWVQARYIYIILHLIIYFCDSDDEDKDVLDEGQREAPAIPLECLPVLVRQDTRNFKVIMAFVNLCSLMFRD